MVPNDTFFDDLAEDYDRIFASELGRTDEQVDFAVRVLGIHIGQRVLDICCGTGRHALALAKRGYLVTGVDRSAAMLSVASRKAEVEGTHVQWVEADARLLPPLPPFAGATCFFNSWGYTGDIVQDGMVLTSIAKRLQPGSRLVLDVPNETWLRTRPRGIHRSVGDGIAIREERSYDVVNQVLQTSWTILRRHAPHHQAVFRCRVYRLDQIETMLSRAGLVLDLAFGGFQGEPLTALGPRCITVARRPILPL